MRRSGATLQQIADKIGRTKERVRQILTKNFGTTKRKLMSTEKLCNLMGLPRNWVMQLYQDGVISPAAAWHTETRLFLLWAPATIDHIINYYKTRRLCRICYRPIPKGRWRYCSTDCLKESHKYKYRSAEARQRHIESIKRYREKQRQLAPAVMKNSPEYQSRCPVLSGIAE